MLLLLFYDNLQALQRTGLAIHIILPHNANFVELQGSICLSSNMKVNTECCRKTCDLWSLGMLLPHWLVKSRALTAIKHKSTVYEAAQFYYYFSNFRIFLLGIEPPWRVIYYLCFSSSMSLHMVVLEFPGCTWHNLDHFTQAVLILFFIV